MKVTYSWLKEYVALAAPAELAKTDSSFAKLRICARHILVTKLKSSS